MRKAGLGKNTKILVLFGDVRDSTDRKIQSLGVQQERGKFEEVGY